MDGNSTPGTLALSSAKVLSEVVADDGLGRTPTSIRTCRLSGDCRGVLSVSSTVARWAGGGLMTELRKDVGIDARSRCRTLSWTRERREGLSSSMMPASRTLESGSGLCISFGRFAGRRLEVSCQEEREAGGDVNEDRKESERHECALREANRAKRKVR